MTISVIIPCRNEKRHIAEFLDSLLDQDLDAAWKLEVLVADGMSDDGTREILREYALKAPAVRMIDNPGRIVSTGLNAAIDASSGEIVVRMDAHTVYSKEYIRECVRALEVSGADNVGGPWVAKGRGPIGEAIAAAFQSPFCCGGGKAHDPDYEGEVDTVYLGCWPRSVFDRVGLFDPGLVRNQDDEFNFRLRRSGGRVWQSPRIQSFYTPRSSIRAVFRQYLQYGFWKVAVMRKHGGVASWRHLVPVAFVCSLLIAPLVVAFFAVLGDASAATWIARPFAVELATYALACVAAAAPLARSLSLRGLLATPFIIAVHQVSYGLGFLIGLLTPAKGVGGRTGPANLFTALTR